MFVFSGKISFACLPVCVGVCVRACVRACVRGANDGDDSVWYR